MTSESHLTTIWKSTLGELEVELGKANFGLYFKNSSLTKLDDKVANISFPNKVMADQANSRYYSLIQIALQKHTKIDRLSLVFEVLPSVGEKTRGPDNQEIGPLFSAPKEDKEAVSQAINKAKLRPDFTLEDFCVSTSNQLAFAAAQAVIKSPGRNYNPLFLWGGVGIGKTHLMQAIGHEIIRANPGARVVCVTSEQFTNEIVEGIRTKNTKDFKDKYRSVDALLVDDIQFIGGKDRAQEEFFHTFNALQQKQGQIVVTSDTKPSDIKYLEDRLKSRFEGGMVADISEPDHELKTAICLLKSKKRGMELSTTVASLIADSVDNIRTLDGALQRILTEAEMNHKTIDESFISRVLKIPTEPGASLQAPRIDGRLILDVVCQFYNLPMKLIKGEKRDKLISLPRQIIMYLLRKNTTMTVQEIAAFLNRADHTTILHGVKKIDRLVEENDKIRQDVDTLSQLLTPVHISPKP